MTLHSWKFELKRKINTSFFSRENSTKLKFPKNYLAQNSNLGTVGNNPVLARRMIRWLSTVFVPISYFYDLRYDSSRELPLSWQRSMLPQLQNVSSGFLYLQVLFMNRRHWQKQSEVKPPAPSWRAAGLGTDLQPWSFCLAPFLLLSHSTMSSPKLQLPQFIFSFCI